MSTPEARLELSVAARSDQGRVRNVNQDFAYAGPLPGLPDWQLLVVADGVGGHQAGEWASQKAVETLVQDLAARLVATEPLKALACAFEAANREIWSAAASHAAFAGAATTVVAALSHGRSAWWGNVGDSRLYLVRGGAAQRITRDHSLVEEQVRSGRMTREEAATSDQRNVITRSVGFEEAVSVDSGGPIELRRDDVLVLCSDGIHGLLSDDEIADAGSSLGPVQSAERMISLGNARGGPDNLTAVVGRLREADRLIDTTRFGASDRLRHRPGRVIALTILVLGVLAGGAFAALRTVGPGWWPL
jgi:serine/threonine protein phosphatase PrpC